MKIIKSKKRLLKKKAKAGKANKGQSLTKLLKGYSTSNQIVFSKETFAKLGERTAALSAPVGHADKPDRG